MSKIDLELKGTDPTGLINACHKDEFFSLGVNSSDSEDHSTYTPHSAETNFEKWSSLFLKRENTVNTPELSAQEKYAYARLVVSEGGGLALGTQIILQPGYQVAKLIFPSKLFEWGSKPVSPASLDQLLAGLQGAVDGLKDYIHINFNEKDSLSQLINSKDSAGSDSEYRAFQSKEREYHLDNDPGKYNFEKQIRKENQNLGELSREPLVKDTILP